MRKTLIAAALTSLVSAGLVTTTTATAEAAGQSVNRAEFRAIRVGMTRARVHQIFGANGVAYGGRQTWYYGEIDAASCADGETWACAEQTREYRVSTSRYGSIDVDYYRTAAGVWRVSLKRAYWG